MTSYFKQASISGLILQFAFTYTDDNRLKLNDFKTMMALADYLDRQNIVDKFATYADKHGLQRRNLLIQKSHKLLERYLNSRIIYNMLDESAWHQYINQDDPTVKAALDVFKRKEAFPKRPEPKSDKPKNRKTAHAALPYDYSPLHQGPQFIANA